nr:MAG TPA: hypothetical protein [Caudoviricetes sp.]
MRIQIQNKKIKLICLKIDNNELKTTDKNEWIKFIRKHRGKVSSIEQFNWEIPQNKLQKALEYSFDELYKFKMKENGKTLTRG